MFKLVTDFEFNVEAYARKEELGGGFRGRAIVKNINAGTKERIETEIHETQHAAWVDICAKVWAISEPTNVGHYSGNKYRKNYWVHRKVPVDSKVS